MFESDGGGRAGSARGEGETLQQRARRRPDHVFHRAGHDLRSAPRVQDAVRRALRRCRGPLLTRGSRGRAERREQRARSGGPDLAVAGAHGPRDRLPRELRVARLVLRDARERGPDRRILGAGELLRGDHRRHRLADAPLHHRAHGELREPCADAYPAPQREGPRPQLPARVGRRQREAEPGVRDLVERGLVRRTDQIRRRASREQLQREPRERGHRRVLEERRRGPGLRQRRAIVGGETLQPRAVAPVAPRRRPGGGLERSELRAVRGAVRPAAGPADDQVHHVAAVADAGFDLREDRPRLEPTRAALRLEDAEGGVERLRARSRVDRTGVVARVVGLGGRPAEAELGCRRALCRSPCAARPSGAHRAPGTHRAPGAARRSGAGRALRASRTHRRSRRGGRRAGSEAASATGAAAAGRGAGRRLAEERGGADDAEDASRERKAKARIVHVRDRRVRGPARYHGPPGGARRSCPLVALATMTPVSGIPLDNRRRAQIRRRNVASLLRDGQVLSEKERG